MSTAARPSRDGIVALLSLAFAALPWLIRGPTWPAFALERLDHCPLPACDLVRVYLPQAAALRASPGTLVTGWVYPPLLAVLLEPLAALPESVAVSLVIILNICFAFILFMLVLRALAPAGLAPSARAALALALVSLSLPVWHTLKWGQVSLLLAVGAIWAIRRGGAAGAAVIGALAAIKLYPAVYLVDWLARRQVRSALVGGATAAALGLGLPALALGGHSLGLFLRGVAAAMGLVNLGPWGGQALAPSLERWLADGRHIGLSTSLPPVLFSAPGLARPLAAALSLGVAVGTAHRLIHARPAPDVAAALLLCGVGLALPPGWHHYFAFLPFALAVALARGDGRARALALGGAALSALPVLAVAWDPARYFALSRLGITTLSAALTWGALMALRREP